MSGKLKLIGAEPTQEMLKAMGYAGPADDDDFAWSRAEYKAAWSAAPNDATERLIAVLKNMQWLLDNTTTAYAATTSSTRKQIDTLLKELE